MLSDSSRRSRGGPAPRARSLRLVAAVGAVLALTLVAAVGGTDLVRHRLARSRLHAQLGLGGLPARPLHAVLLQHRLRDRVRERLHADPRARHVRPADDRRGTRVVVEGGHPTRYVYKVRQGIKFSDGTPITAADVAFSINVHRDKKTGFEDGALLRQRQSIAAKGQHVTVRSQGRTRTGSSSRRQPGPRLLEGGLPEEAREFGTPSDIPIGTGPYKFAEFHAPTRRSCSCATRSRRARSTRGTRIVFSVIPDAKARLLALQSGQIDGTFAIPEQRHPRSG